MGFHGIVRATEDIDVMLHATPENLERLRSALRAAYPGDPYVDELKPEDWLGDYPVVRYAPQKSSLLMDLMTRLGDAATFDSIESEIKEVDGVRVRVATPRALYRLKRGTLRPLDHQDARMLADAFGLKEED